MNVPELQEALHDSNRRYNDALMVLNDLVYWSQRLNNVVATVCEAHLAGDKALLQQVLDRVAPSYRENLKSPVRMH